MSAALSSTHCASSHGKLMAKTKQVIICSSKDVREGISTNMFSWSNPVYLEASFICVFSGSRTFPQIRSSQILGLKEKSWRNTLLGPSSLSVHKFDPDRSVWNGNTPV